MNLDSLAVRLAVILALLASVPTSSATVLSVTGNDTLVGNRPTNLITNGSFEADAGVATNGSYWATGTGFSPTMSLSAWTASGQVASYAIWGSDGFGGIQSSAPFPHGTNGLYFGAGIMALVIPFPTEAANGLVTFSNAPVIQPKPTDGPVTLQQTVSGLNPSSTYLLDFWTSGEMVGQPGLPVDGFFGLNISGEATLYFAAPSGNGLVGPAQRYQVYFTPTASTVTFEWVNWGHYLDPNGMSDELVLDDVILNLVSNAPTPLDCNCLTNVILTCPAVVPDLCAMFSSCFTTNMLPGSCTQNFPPGMPLSVGTYPLQLQVMDLQSNTVSCIVTIDVLPPAPATPLTLACPTNKTVECGSNWSFDAPSVLSSCCGVNITWSDLVISNSPCDIQYKRTWVFTDGCNNVQSCNQTVTTVDTTPPGPPCNGFNMVLNGSFELITNCPSSISQFDVAAPWFTPTSATTDLYSDCAGIGSSVTVPTNLAGIHPPASGNNYAGAAIFSTYGTNPTNSYREYLEVPLVTALTAGQQYQVSFYVRRSGTWGHAIADIGARFLPLAYTDYGPISNQFSGVLPFTAQIENPTNNVITSTNSWTLIQGVYTAIGWETHLVLGNFKDDPSTTSTFVGGDFNDYAYYLFDDVSVVAICNSNMPNQVVQCGQPFSLDPFPIVDNCSGTNITVSSVTTTSGVCPQTITRLWTVADACGNMDTLTQTVTIVDTNPPVLLCGANLVPNPQFENFANCPFYFGQVDFAAPWFNPTIATPDYMNSCSTFWPMAVPANLMGSETPNSGNGYMGAFAYSVYGTNPVPGYREYIETPLLAPLQAGVTYQVSFNVSLADSSGWAIAELGAHFSTGPVTASTQGPLNVVPQVENPGSSPLTVTNGWMLISSTYTATGGEDHITLGNFRSDANTTAVTAGGTNHSYYYFDDISVTPLCSIGDKTVLCGVPWSFDTPAAIDDCSGTNVSVTVLSTVTNSPCPLVIERAWALTDLCGNTTTWTQTVTAVDITPPSPYCTFPNLVPNGQFEFNSSCPSNLSQLNFASPWYPATDGSPDAYASCAPPTTTGTPTNIFGVQNPYDGQGYAGAYLYSLNQGTNLVTAYREYIQVPLLAPLVASQSYPVSFRVCLTELSGQAIAEIGAHFSVGPVTNYGGYTGVLNVTPQVINPSTNIITSTNNWVLISGNYTAVGGETHLTIGNFNSDAATTALPSTGWLTSYAYYYIDDVRVGPPCPPLPPEKVIPCGQPVAFDIINGYDDCSGTNLNTVITTVTNSLCPFNATRTWTLTDLCGNTTNVSQTIIVVDYTPPQLLCLGSNLVPNARFENFMPCPTGLSELDAAYPWNRASDATPDYFNSCNNNVVSVPANQFGSEVPFSGQGYAGACSANSNGETNPLACYREYLQVPLNAPLVAAQTYPVSFRVSLADVSGYAIANLGAHFSVGSISNGIVGVLNAVPQVVNAPNNILSSTNGWMLVSGFYTATGGETHLTLGCFVTDALATGIPIYPNATNGSPYSDLAYYYFDDVYVGDACSIAPIVNLPCGTPWSFPEVAGYDNCSGTNITLDVTTVTNSLCPLNIQRTWTLVDQCQNTNVVSQTVIIGDNEPPIPICAGGTNLVPNESFEASTNCPTDLSQLGFAVPWYQPTQATPDWFNTCSTTNLVGVPANFMGNQTPFTGQAYAGMIAYSLNYDYREYLQAPLAAPLVAGQTYTVSFRASLAEQSGWALAELGAHLSVGPVTNYSMDTVLPVVPQVENPSANMLTNLNGWSWVVGTYTAVGGETHITVGNFRTDANTTVLPASGPETSQAYYYIDDIRVELGCGNQPEVLVPCGTPWTFPTVTGYDLCAGTNVTITINDITNSVCPLIVNRTWTLSDPCGNTTNLSQTVFTMDAIPPTVDCACLLAAVEPLLITNGCPAYIPDFSFLSNSPCFSDNCGPIQIFQSPAAGTSVGPGAHPINITIADCGGNATNCMVTFNVLATLGGIQCPGDIYVLTCSNSLPVNYTVNTFGNIGPMSCTPPPGSLFPLGTNQVNCLATNSCGDVVVCNFKVIVRPARQIKWFCISKVIGIPWEIIGIGGGGGGSSAFLSILPDLPDGGHAALFENLGSSGQDGVRFDLGPAESFTFTTELDFNAPLGARFDLVIPPGAGATTGTPLLSFVRGTNVHDGWEMLRATPALEPPGNLYRAVAIGTNGELFSSVTQDAASLNTNLIATVAPMNGVTSVVMTVEVDCTTHAVSLGFPHCEWMLNAQHKHKGWDGCIYGPGKPVKNGTNHARVIFMPVNPHPTGPITNLDLVVSNLTQWPIYNPLLGSQNRKWGDGHVTLMKAYDDGTEQGLDFTALGEGGGVAADLGHAGSFSFRIDRFHNGDIPDQQELYRVIGWPPGTTINRPPPPTNYLRLAPTGMGSGLPPTVEVAADFTQWGASNVTVQLWNGTLLVDQTNLPAVLANSLVILDKLPELIGSPSVGVLSLASSNGTLTVLSGLACTSGTCEGNELRIIADMPPAATPPTAYTGLECVIGDGMDLRLSGLQTSPACSPAPINVERTATGVTLTWSADGFRLQGAEKLTGPWHDLGVSSPVTLPANSSLRVFRLICD
jgi:hypothetical protein